MNEQIRKFLSVIMLVAFLLLPTACATQTVYQDGHYEARSEKTDKHGGYGKISLDIQDGKINTVDFQVYTKEDKLKDEDYSAELKSSKPELYQLAQNSILANPQYAAALLEYQRLEDVDVVAGATWNYELFQDAAAIALGEASK